jgi:hypothetical protein
MAGLARMMPYFARLATPSVAKIVRYREIDSIATLTVVNYIGSDSHSGGGSPRCANAHRLEGMPGIAGVKGVKSVNIVKILANLIDNAFEEVMSLEPERRCVHVEGWIEKDRGAFTSGEYYCPLRPSQPPRCVISSAPAAA